MIVFRLFGTGHFRSLYVVPVVDQPSGLRTLRGPQMTEGSYMGNTTIEQLVNRYEAPEPFVAR